MNHYAAQIYIDGSCPKNPTGAGGFAGVLELPDDIKGPSTIFQEGFVSTTNNRMEMRALIAALKWVKKNKSLLINKNINEAEIWSDSSYTLNAYNYGEIYRSNGWMDSEGITTKNPDLIRRIISLKGSVGFACKPQWIKNKSTEATRAVDKLAKAAVEMPILTKDDGYIKPRASKTKVSGQTLPIDSKGQILAIQVFEHGPISAARNTMYKVKFEILNNGTLEKYYAFTTKEINKILHRWHYYEITLNDSDKKPKIESANEIGESDYTLCD